MESIFNDKNSEPEFRAFRKRLLIYGFTVGIIGFPVGIALNEQFLWILSIIAIIVGGIKLKNLINK